MPYGNYHSALLFYLADLILFIQFLYYTEEQGTVVISIGHCQGTVRALLGHCENTKETQHSIVRTVGYEIACVVGSAEWLRATDVVHEWSYSNAKNGCNHRMPCIIHSLWLPCTDASAVCSQWMSYMDAVKVCRQWTSSMDAFRA